MTMAVKAGKYSPLALTVCLQQWKCNDSRQKKNSFVKC